MQGQSPSTTGLGEGQSESPSSAAVRPTRHNLGHFQVKGCRRQLSCCLHIHTLDFMTTTLSYILSENVFLCVLVCACHFVQNLSHDAVAAILAILYCKNTTFFRSLSTTLCYQGTLFALILAYTHKKLLQRLFVWLSFTV